MALADKVQAAKQFLTTRKRIYCRLFQRGNLDAEFVLGDLAKFCRAHESTAHANTHIAARLDGRREVWLRIQTHLNLSDEELWRLHGVTRTSEKG